MIFAFICIVSGSLLQVNRAYGNGNRNVNNDNNMQLFDANDLSRIVPYLADVALLDINDNTIIFNGLKNKIYLSDSNIDTLKIIAALDERIESLHPDKLDKQSNKNDNIQRKARRERLEKLRVQREYLSRKISHDLGLSKMKYIQVWVNEQNLLSSYYSNMYSWTTKQSEITPLESWEPIANMLSHMPDKEKGIKISELNIRLNMIIEQKKVYDNSKRLYRNEIFKRK